MRVLLLLSMGFPFVTLYIVYPTTGNHWDDVIVKYKEVDLEMHLDRAVNGQYGSEGLFAKKNVSLVQFKLDNFSAVLRNALSREPFNLSDEDTQEMLFQSAHVIDLAEDGWIGPHVDSIKFSGDMIAGVSLLSSRIMKMTLLPKEEIQFPANYFMDINEYWQQFPYETHINEKDLVLPPRSMYIMSGIWRYGYQHAILPSPGHRRLSIIFRNELP
jgi:hypothetical protein